MKKLLVLMMLLVPCVALAAKDCKVYENADLKDMSTEELQKKMENNKTLQQINRESADSFSKIQNYNRSIELNDEAINCEEQAKRVERVLKARELEKNPPSIPQSQKGPHLLY